MFLSLSLLVTFELFVCMCVCVCVCLFLSRDHCVNPTYSRKLTDEIEEVLFLNERNDTR